MILEVKPVDEKIFGLYVDGVLLGTSKSDCDARFAMHILEKAAVQKMDKEKT